MPLGQSVPIASPVAALAGFLAGEAVGFAVKAVGGGEFAQRFGKTIGHWAASSIAGYAINTVMLADVTGAAVTTVQSPLTAAAHGLLTPSPSGHPMGPGPLRF